MRDLLAPQVEHFQALLLPGVVLHLLGHMACLAPVCVPCPLLRQGQAEVEQGMVVARDVAHENAHLAVVDLAPVAIPLTLHPNRMRPPLREAAGIKGDHTIGFPQLLDYLSNQDLDQRTMIPGRGADERLDDQTLDIDQGGDLLGILAVQMGQEPCQIEVHMAFAGLGLKRVLIGHHEGFCRKFSFEAICGMISLHDQQGIMEERDDGDQFQRGPFPTGYHPDGRALVCGV